MSSTIPPLPPGFVLEPEPAKTAATKVPPPPPGFELEGAAQQPAASPVKVGEMKAYNPSFTDLLGEAFNTLVGKYDDRPLIARVQDATGKAVDAVTPDGLQRGLIRGKQGTAIALDMAGIGPKTVYGPESDSYQTAVRLADLNRQAERYAAPEARQQALQNISQANSVGELFDAVTQAPGQSAAAVGDVVLESLGTSLPSLLLTAGGSMAGPAGTAAAAGAGSFATEYTQTVLQKIQERGGDPSDPNTWAAARNDPAFMADAKQSALERGVPIAAFDALTAGMAGKFLDGAQGVRQVATASAKEAGVQMGGGMAGETTAQLADKGKVTSVGDIALEGFAELPSAVVETGGNLINARKTAGIPPPPPGFEIQPEQPAPEPVAAAPETPAPPQPTSPAPVEPIAPSPAPTPTVAGATIQPAEPPAPQPAPAPAEPQAAQPAPVEPQAAPQPVAAPAAPEGNRRTVTTASGRKVDTEFQVVDLSTLQAASGDLQNRDRSRATSDLQIQNIAGTLDPERLGESAEADRGAPIIGPDNIVESGNGRVAAIRKAYESIPERAEAYKQFLQKQGYAIDGMAQPVLVRRRVTDMTPEERRAFVIESNTSATARLNAVEQAKSDADLVGDDVLQLYNGGEFGAAGNRDFIRALVGKLPQSEQSALYGTDGALSQEGIRRVQNAMLARAYDDAALLSKFTEDQDNNIRSIGGAMLDVAGSWAALRGDVRAGRIKPEFDITKSLVEAARRITVARDRGETVQQVLAQVDAFNPMDPITERLIRTFYTSDLSRAIGRDKITEALRAYTVEAQKQTNEASLFGDLPPVTPEQLLDVELGKRVDAKPAQQTSMFGASGKPSVQTTPEPQAAPAPAPAAAQQSTGDELEARAKALEPRVMALSQEDAKAALQSIGEKPRVNRDPRDQIMEQHPDDIEAALKSVEAKPEPKAEPKKKKSEPQAKRKIGEMVEVTNTETGTYTNGDESGTFEFIEGEDADGNSVAIARLYDPSGKMVREVKFEGLVYLDTVGFHNAVFGKDSDSTITREIDLQYERLIKELGAEPTFNKKGVPVYSIDLPEGWAKDYFKEFIDRTPGHHGFSLETSKKKTGPRYTLTDTRWISNQRYKPDAMEDTLNDGRTTSRANDGEDTDGIAEDEADLLAELDDKPAQNTRGRGSSPETMRVSFTDRRSWAEQAFEDAGVDPDTATLWPIDQQFAVLAQLMKDRFGITVKKTETLQGRYAVDQMLDLYRNLQFMTYTMGMPSNAMGLRGKLTLVLRKGIQYFGAFYPMAARVEGVSFPAGTVVLPKRSNSFSHEWMHALDHFLMQQFPTPGSFALLSQQVKGKGIDYAPNSVKEAFVRVMDNLFYDQASMAAKVMALELQLENQNLSKAAREKAEAQLETLKRGNARSKDVKASDYKKTSAGFDPGKSDYWANPQEMLARAFEAYTAFKVEMAGGSTEAIAKGNLAYLSMADKRLAETFPKGDDRLRIFAAFDDMFVQLAKEQIISDGVPANAPGNVTQFDPHIWHRTPAKKAEHKGIMGALRETADEMKASMARMRREDARPDNPKPLGQRIQDVAKEYTSSEMAAFRILEKRYPRSKALRALANLLVPEPGANRTVARVFEDAAEIHFKTMINRLSNIMERYDLQNLDETETRTLRDLLISESVPNAPDNIRKAATELRRLLDMEWYNNQQAGLDIGYTKNGFLPRLLDMAMVVTDRAGFVKAAAKVYEIIFDKEFGADAMEVMDRGDNYSGVIAFLKQAKFAGLAVKPAVKLIRQLRKLERSLKTSQDPDIVKAKIADTSDLLLEEIEALYDSTRTAYGIRRAEHWHTAIMTADTQDFDAMSPDSRYTKSRKLPPEADKLMENYYINDPIEAIQTYFSQSARRTEYARRFGAKGEKMQKFFDSMTAEGVAPEDQEYVADMVSRLTGRARQTVSPATARFLSGLQAIGLITMLPRAVWSSVAEPINAAWRTGEVKNIFLPHVNMIKGIVGTADAKEWAELSRVIGLVTNAMADTLAANRFGGNYGDSVKMQRVMAQFGQRSMLHGITNASRTAILPLQHEYLHGLARRITEGRDVANSAALMREVGISDPAAFSEWVMQSDRMPTMEELFDSNGIETKFGTEWITAMHRISDQTIQNPKSYNRPKMANNPHGRLVYGILSFSMSFYENVWKRTAKQLKGMSDRSGPGSAAKYAALNVLPAMTALFIAQTLVSTLREALFNPERWEEWEKEGVLVERLLQLGFTRTFSFGLADVPIQSFTGLKYQRDLSNMFIGAVPSYFLQALQGLLQPVVSNSDKTNNAEYKAAQSAYQLIMAPSIAYALSMAPGGRLIDPMYGFGMQYFTAPASRDAVADAVVGEKDSRIQKQKAAEKKAEDGRSGGREGGREGGR